LNDASASPEHATRPAQTQGESSRRAARFAALPPLAAVTAAAAALDLVANRILLRSLADSLSHGTLVELSRWGALPRNLTAIGGLVALGICLVGFLSLRHGPPLADRVRQLRGQHPRDEADQAVGIPLLRRVSIAGFAGILFPTVVLATFLPPQRLTEQVVMFAAGAAYVLTVLVASTATRWRGGSALRIGTILAAASAFFSLGALVLDAVHSRWQLEMAVRASSSLRHMGELCYLAMPLAFARSVLSYRGHSRFWVDAATVGATVALVTVFLVVGKARSSTDLNILLYGAQGVALLLAWPIVYGLPIGLGFGVGLAAATRPRAPTTRQAGVGMLLFYSAGYAPTNPAQLLMMVFGAALLARTAIAVGSPGRELHSISETPRQAA
jgi:hypothetical protein